MRGRVGLNMDHIRGWFVCNGAQYAFVSLEGDFKWVYYNLLKHMKKWKIRGGYISVNDKIRYFVFVRAMSIRIYRSIDGHNCVYKREG